MKKTKCSKCDVEIKNCNYSKHYESCDGSGPYTSLKSCKWCDKIFLENDDRSNHTRWCDKNPKRQYYNKNCQQLHTDEAIRKRNLKIKKAHSDGKYDHIDFKTLNVGRKHTEETKKKLSEKALNSNHRRLVRSIRNYVKKDGSIVKLDSSWEEELAKRLDNLNIRWNRPEPIKWIDSNGVSRNYFPDFYLLDYDIFLDPKNPAAVKVQQEKINCLKDQVKNLIILTTLDECKIFKI